MKQVILFLTLLLTLACTVCLAVNVCTPYLGSLMETKDDLRTAVSWFEHSIEQRFVCLEHWLVTTCVEEKQSLRNTAEQDIEKAELMTEKLPHIPQRNYGTENAYSEGLTSLAKSWKGYADIVKELQVIEAPKSKKIEQAG